MPGSPTTGVPPTTPIAAGRPGFTARRQKTREPAPSMAARTWSSSPVDTPPEVTSRSCEAAASRSPREVSPASSGRMPRSETSQGRRASSAISAKRLLS